MARFLRTSPLTPPRCIPGSGQDSREAAGTTHQSGAKSTGAWISHSSVSGPVSASKEKRVGSDDGGVAVKLGGQENRAAPAEGEAGVCRHFVASPILQGAHRTGPNLLSTPKALTRSLPRRPFISTDPKPGGLFSTPVALPRSPLSGPTPSSAPTPGHALRRSCFRGCPFFRPGAPGAPSPSRQPAFCTPSARPEATHLRTGHPPSRHPPVPPTRS